MFDAQSISFGVVDSRALYTDAQRDGARYDGPITDVRDLLSMAYAFHLDQLFITPQSQPWKRARRYRRAFFNPETIGVWKVRPAKLANVVTAWRDGRRVQLIFPGATTISAGWALDNITDARELFAKVATLQKWLGAQISEPIRTAKRIAVEGMKQSGGRFITPVPGSLQIFKDHGEKDIYYKRPLWTNELNRKFLHVYDKEAMYLPALACPFGAGEYLEVFNGWQFNAAQPGLWNVELKATPRTPSSAAELLGGYDLDGWFYSPMLRIYEKQGYKITVRRALVWQKTARYFEGLYKAAKGALGEFGRGSVERDCVKALYTQFTGWLGRNNTPTEPDAFYRPDIRSLIISEAKARLHANVFEVYRQTGMMPAGVRVDALFYFSDEPDPARALPHPVTSYTGPRDVLKPAQYKHSYTVPGELAREAFARFDKISRVDDFLEGKGGFAK